ncbi:Ribosomal RNA small subunit methyltransferase H [Koleobacter methoxysyntrophicus]|jgi:predicted methyltransferase|uniref:Ribosomal RNA small subunit methyltransferase H n=1 Tax=Koleobacter methoxysyntrophicus TaxID=2751313 RepID=A0A8A0RRX2_9FIRM|nr:class I SAM-dependent methyltransferase [Koleobacter methoxysyntrophicus]MDK2901132.1 hypothetical protein [Thermosediminibacterales bacterium]QSQ10117.1 Ribosomal RNA small subunit methyltransferase H [Koleobacter methoxysyntrophicus]
MSVRLKRALDFAKDIVKGVIEDGDIVVDCTAGNGKDTLFLAELVGTRGKVYAFDIQNVAIENTRKALIDKGFIDRVTLICDGHEHILKYVRDKITCAVFNLGYLPGGNRNIITVPDKVIKAIKSCLELLLPGGIISIVSYTGHPGGKEELEAIIQFLKTLDQKKYAVANYRFLNQKNDPPQLIIIEKGRGERNWQQY